MSTEPIAVESLHAEYAERIAATVRLDVTGYGATPDGLAALLRDTAGRLSPVDSSREWLGEAAISLDAAARLNGSGPRAEQEVHAAVEARAVRDGQVP